MADEIVYSLWRHKVSRFDGDLVMITDNKVLLRKHIKYPALMCIQRKAEKKVPTEEDFVKSNIATFGNEIGQTTNWITSMYEARSKYEPGSVEYDALMLHDGLTDKLKYRIIKIVRFLELISHTA